VDGYVGQMAKKSFWNAYDHLGGCILLNLLWSLLSLRRGGGRSATDGLACLRCSVGCDRTMGTLPGSGRAGVLPSF